MTVGGFDPKALGTLSKANSDKMDLIRFKNRMDGLKKRLTAQGEDGDKTAELRKACKGFEAIFISKLWKGMKSTVPKEGYLHSKQEDMYMGMFDRPFAESMAEAGGMGLADMIFDQLKDNLINASKNALTGKANIKPLKDDGKGIPLNKVRGALDAAKRKATDMTLEDWGVDAANSGDAAKTADASKTPVASTTSKSSAMNPVISGGTEPGVLSDIEVKARIDALVRKLETRADKVGLKNAKNS